MKNFKKVLALVLAIATLLSFATVASAKTADFADAKDVKNVEAVDVLSYIKVLEGYPADKSFKPAKNITREEAAKIIAIFANKSTDISSLYTSANPFADMKGRWGESYVAYGYRAGIIAGKNATSFVPKANVKGTEFLKMVLVVLGYDQNKEGLVGSSWAVNTLELAKVKGLLKGLDNFDANAALTRDQAAQIMLNALKAEKVVYGQTITNLTWNAKTGYWMTTNTASNAVYVSPNGAVNNYEHKLLAADFNLTLTDSTDKWGRPTHTWKKGTATIGEYVDSDKLLKTYSTAITECTVANDCSFTTDMDMPVVVNGKSIGKYKIQRLDTVGTIGAQGRLTEVYEDRIVMIDTFLAKVEKVTDATYDVAGHLKTEATISLTAFDADTASTAAHINVVLTNGSTNYGYVKGDYVLINAYTVENSNTVSASGRIQTDNEGTVKPYAEIVGKAESFEGAQTVLWYNTAKHTVSGTVYDDALRFHLDQAGTDVTNHTWFKDSYGNLIGVVDVATSYTYGVITEMWYAGDFATGAGKALANVTYIDGTTNQITISKFQLDGNTTNTYSPVAGTYAANVMVANVNTADASKSTIALSYTASQNETADTNGIIAGHLFQMSTLADGTVKAVEVLPHENGGQTNIARGVMYYTKSGLSYAAAATVDSNTKFLIRSTEKGADGKYTFKAVTGIKDFSKFSAANTKVDIVVDENNYAGYVYIIGDPDDAVTKGFAYIVGSSYNATLKDDGTGVKYYEVTLATKTEDGTAYGTVKVKATDWTKTVTSFTVGTTTYSTLGQVLTAPASYGKLFYLTYTGDYVTDASVVALDGNYVQKNANDANSWVVGYNNSANDASYNGNVLKLGSAYKSFYIDTAVTPVVGSLTNLDGKVIYVIGNKDGIVSKVYVVDNDSAQSSTVPGKATLTYVAKLYNKNGDYVKDIVMGSQEVAFTNASAPSETFTPSYTVAHGYMTAPVAGFTGTATASVDALVLSGYQLASADTQSVTVNAGATKTVEWMLIAK